MSETEDEKPSIEEILMLLLHQTMRNYDILVHLLKHFEPEEASLLVESHEKMELWGPPPFLLEE